MKTPVKIYRNRGRMIKNRSGSWLLTFTLDGFAGTGRPGTGYQQLRGKRDDLVDHAASLGITALYLPGVVGELPIEYVKAKLDEIERGIDEYGDRYATPF